MSDQLKPCPCGSLKLSVDAIEPIQFDNRKSGVYWTVVCICGWRGPVRKAKRNAIKVWNIRRNE